jgi:hypothetical protein
VMRIGPDRRETEKVEIFFLDLFVHAF